MLLNMKAERNFILLKIVAKQQHMHINI